MVGILGRQLWSAAGPEGRTDVSQLLLQPFVNYNLANGWYLVSAPIILANWTADSPERWSVPVGGGVGKIFKIGSQPMNASLQGYGVALSSVGANIPPSLITGRVPKRPQDSNYLVPAFPRSPFNIALTVPASCSRQYGLARIGGRSATRSLPLSNVSVA